MALKKYRGRTTMLVTRNRTNQKIGVARVSENTVLYEYSLGVTSVSHIAMMSYDKEKTWNTMIKAVLFL